MSTERLDVKLTSFAREIHEVLRDEGPIIYDKNDPSMSLAMCFGYPNADRLRLERALRELCHTGLAIERCDGRSTMDKRGKRRSGAVVVTYSAT